MADCGCGADRADRLERSALIALLWINAVMFVVELLVGLLAESTGLIADSLDMLADAGVYGLSLYAVGKGLQQQASTARVSGILQMTLAAGVLIEVLRRFVVGSEPESTLMMAVAGVALIANIGCLVIIARHRNAGVHMRASWIFSTNDVIANLGVIIAGALVLATGSRYPDLIIGSIIAGVVLRGGIQILKEANRAQQTAGCHR